MVNTQSKVIVKNKDDIVLNTDLSNLYNNLYPKGYNLIKCLDNEWLEIKKLQKKNKTHFYSLKLSNFDNLLLSKECYLFADNLALKRNELNKSSLIYNTKGLDIKPISRKRSYGVGYSIIVDKGKFVQVDDYFVRFDEVKGQK